MKEAARARRRRIGDARCLPPPRGCSGPRPSPSHRTSNPETLERGHCAASASRRPEKSAGGAFSA